MMSMRLESQSTRSGTLLPYFVTLAIVAPSPALTPGVVGLLSPGALVAIAVLSLRRNHHLESDGAGLQRRLQLPVLATVLLAVSSLADPQTDSIQRAIARVISAAAFYSLALVFFKSPEDDRRKIGLAVLSGAVLAALLVVIASLRSRGFFGADILPSRDFILPIGVAKTTGVPRSFGELGLILAAGLATRSAITNHLARNVLTAIIVSGFVIGQSRNMLVVLAAVTFCLLIRQYVRSLSGVAGLIGMLALLSPMVATALVSQSAVREQFVGEGIFERNVDARLSLLEEVSALGEQGSVLLRPLGSTRAEWATIADAAPHNHFISLLVFDGYAGVFYIVVMYLMPILRSGKRARALFDDEFVWIIGAMVALSFYEGAFSASLVIVLALLHARAELNEPVEDPDSAPADSPSLRESIA